MSNIKGIPQKNLYGKLYSVIAREMAAGLYTYDRLHWQKFWNTSLKNIGEFKDLNFNKDADLIEITSLFTVAELLNKVHQSPSRFMVASQAQGHEREIKNSTGKQSWDGFIVDTEQAQAITTPVEQKTNFRHLDAVLTDELSKEFDNFLKDLRSRNKLKGDKCLWIFNISPEVAAGKSRNLQLDKIINSIHSVKDDIAVGAVCFYELTDSQTLSIYCLLFPDKGRSSRLNIQNVHEYMKVVRFKNENIPQLRFPEFTDEWQAKKLGDFSKTFSGGTPSASNKSYYSGEIPFIRSGEISKRTTESFINEKALKNSSAKMVEVGDILYALYGATSGQVAISKIHGAINQAILCIRPDANTYFIYSKLLAEKDRILRTYLQGGQGNLSSEIVKDLKVVLPSSDEQQKIADFLGEVDSKLTLTQTKVAAMHEYKKGVMQALFSGKLRFKDENGNPYPDWEEKKLGDLVSIKTGKKDVNQGNVRGEFPFFTCAKEHTFSDSYSFDGEAILIAGNGDVGHTSYYNGKFEAYQRTYVLQDFELSPRYTYIYLKSMFQAFAETQKQQGSMPYIKLSTLQDFAVPIQSSAEQQKITDFLSALDDKIKLEEAKLASSKEFKKALLQRMFV